MTSNTADAAAILDSASDGPLSSEFYLDQIFDSELKDRFNNMNITIPMKEEENGEIDIDVVNDLPEDASEICAILKAEECKAQYWVAVAQAYATRGNIDQAIKVIKGALDSHFNFDDVSSLENYAAWLNLMKGDLYDDTEAFDLVEAHLKSAQNTKANDFNLLAETVYSLTSLRNKGKKTKFDKEIRNIDILLQRNPKNCYALMGKAKIFFYKQNYLAALKLLQKVLQLNPLLRPDPRIGIGLCYWFLDRKDLANHAWQNSIQIHPEGNLQAKVLISLAKFDDCFLNSASDDEFKTKYIEAMSFAQASYKDDPTNGVILIILSSYYFSKGDFDMVKRVCGKLAEDKRNTSFIQSEALFWLARCRLGSGDILQAQKMFSDAIKLNEQNILARVGNAQCLVIRGEINDAIRTLEKVQEINSKVLEVTYALGMLYSKTLKFREKAIAYLEKYVKIADDQNESVSVPALLRLSTLYESSDLSKSLEYLLKARDEELMSGKSNADISASLFNNLGVFSLLEHNVDEAANFFKIALNNAHNQYINDPKTLEALEITLKFNFARAEEASKDPEKIKDATKLYHEILEKCPHYVTAKIRWLTIACLTDDASVKDAVESLMKDESDDLEVRSFYGWYLKNYATKHGLPKSKSNALESEHHKETLSNFTSHDCYALLSLANVYCSLARESKDQRKKDQYYVRAAQLYQKVLNLDSRNAYAAQGIAIIFAEKKQTGLALEIFRKVRDSLSDITVYLNLGHCLLELKQFAKAIENYDLALTRFTDGNDARLLNYFARAWLFRGIHEKNIEYFKTAFTYVTKSYELDPIPAYKFNITFIQYQLASFIRKLPVSKRSMAALEDALKGLEDAITVLNDMADNPSVHPPYPAEELKLRATAGTNLLKQLGKALEEQKQHEKGFEERFKEAQRLKEEEERKKREEELKAQEKLKEVEEKLVAERKQLEQQQAEWNLMRLEEEKDAQDDTENVESKEKKKRLRKKQSEENSEGSSKRRKKADKPLQRKSSLSKEFIDDSDEEADFSEEFSADGYNSEAEDNEKDVESLIENKDSTEKKVDRKRATIFDDEEEDENTSNLGEVTSTTIDGANLHNGEEVE